jgi:pimeloyl-ACP methyl ester carboxylesterase
VKDISYARAGDVHVAYRVMGEPGGVDVVMVAGAFFSFEMLEEDRVASRFMAGLASLGRLVVFDKRGVGLSDPMSDWERSAQEQWAEDLCAVVETVGLSSAVVVSWEPMGVARVAAALRPELFASMVLVNPSQFTYRLAVLLTPSEGEGLATRSVEEMAFPSRIGEPDFREWLGRAGRSGASPAAAARMWDHLLSYEESLTPANIDVATLVLHNSDCINAEKVVRGVSEEISGASFVQVPGADSYPISGDVDPLIAEIAHFVTGAPSDLAPQRVVAAVLFTDLVDSLTGRSS